jgi:Protein of unknown function (DUF3768)
MAYLAIARGEFEKASASVLCATLASVGATRLLDNDRNGEHDFGAFEHESELIFRKFDYYAPDMEQGTENPADPQQTVRVLTTMLASEY